MAIWCLIVCLGATGSSPALAPDATLFGHTPPASTSAACISHWVRPVASTAANDQPDSFYLYGSTGQGRYQVHHGIEFVNPIGTPVIAVASGTIVVAGTDRQAVWGRHAGYYGQLAILKLDGHCDGQAIYALYGHLAAIQVRLGQHVEQGEIIGQVGMSGIAVGPHLHFEVRVGMNTFDHTRNPELWFDPLPACGTLVGRVVDADRHPLEGLLITIHRAEQPDQYWREVWTYTDIRNEHLNPDQDWPENWALGDVPVGDYILRFRVDGKLYTHPVSVTDGQITFVQFAVTAKNLPKQGPNGIMLLP